MMALRYNLANMSALHLNVTEDTAGKNRRNTCGKNRPQITKNLQPKEIEAYSPR